MRPWLEGKYEERPIQKQATGLKIRLSRLEIGLTQEELAQRAGISRWQLIKIEGGHSQPREQTLKRIMRALYAPTQTSHNLTLAEGASEAPIPITPEEYLSPKGAPQTFQ